MITLGIETATSVCGAALVRGGECLAVREVDEGHVHAERLLPLIDEALREARIGTGDLGCIAVSIGPGSFTGLRIGLSVAKGLALAADIPLVAVPTLEALALRVVDAADGGEILAALDARRDEVYCQFFAVSGGGVRATGPPRDAPVQALHADMGERRLIVTGNGRQKVAAGFPRGGLRLAADGIAGCSALTVARLGERLFQDGQREDAATLEPRYIKEFFLAAAARGAVTDSRT